MLKLIQTILLDATEAPRIFENASVLLMVALGHCQTTLPIQSHPWNDVPHDNLTTQKGTELNLSYPALVPEISSVHGELERGSDEILQDLLGVFPPYIPVHTRSLHSRQRIKTSVSKY